MSFDTKECRQKNRGLWSVTTKMPIKNSYALSLIYTPGVGKCCTEISEDSHKVLELTNKANSLALITDGSFDKKLSGVSAIPILEGKALFYKKHCDIDVYPLVIDDFSQNSIGSIKNIIPNFAVFDLSLCSEEKSHILKQGLASCSDSLFFFKEDRAFIERLAQSEKVLFDSELLYSSLIKLFINLRLDNSSKERIYSLFTDIVKELSDNQIGEYVFCSELTKKIAEETAINYEEQANKKNLIDLNLDLNKNSLNLHKKLKGVIETIPKILVRDEKKLQKLYFPKVEDKSIVDIIESESKAYSLTYKGNTAAIVSDGSAVLGFGNIGPEAVLPVLEGKIALFKKLGDVDVIPLSLATQSVEEIVETVCNFSKSFGAINLEDISAPRCFEIEEKLKEKLDIPVFHDDQHGTAIVLLAAFINALKLKDKKPSEVKVVINGAGAAGLSVAKLLLEYGVKDIILSDINGSIYQGRKKGMNRYLDDIAEKTNHQKIKGELSGIIKNADFFIGLSVGGILTVEMIKTMNPDPVIFALANPIPEIMPNEAKKAGAFIVASGRSDFKNQINNSLVFPGLFRGILDSRAKIINDNMKIKAAKAIADLIKRDELAIDYIIPNALDIKIPAYVAKAVVEGAIETKVNRVEVFPEEIFANTINTLYFN